MRLHSLTLCAFGPCARIHSSRSSKVPLRNLAGRPGTGKFVSNQSSSTVASGSPRDGSWGSARWALPVATVRKV